MDHAEHQQQLARLSELEHTMLTTRAVLESTRQMRADMLQAGGAAPGADSRCPVINKAAYDKSEEIITAHWVAASLAETTYLALYDEMYPDGSLFSYRVVGEVFFVVPA